MDGFLTSIGSAVSQGMIWGIMVLGVYITFRILDFADMTVDGSFALGGCICAVMIVEHGMNPWLACLIAALTGALAGAVTGFLHTMFNIPAILAGILTQISLWSINLRIMGKSNTPLLKVDTIFSRISDLTGLEAKVVAFVLGLVISIAIVFILYWFFGTEIGASLRATGNNEKMIRALGVNTKLTKMIGLMVSNALVGLSGGLLCQSQKYADIGMGTGAIVIGLAAIVIGEVLLGRLRSFGGKLAAAVVGAIVYFVIRAIVLRLGMDANDMKMLSAIIVALALCVPVAIEKFRISHSYSEGGSGDVSSK